MDLVPQRPDLLTRALRVQWALIGYNVLEGVAAVTFGVWAHSIALVGFGIDSAIEVTSASILIWRLAKERRGEAHEVAERKAHLIVGITFLALATYVGYESISRLVHREAAEASVPGLILSALSLTLMPAFGIAKLRLARRLGSPALRADAMETLVCAYLSLSLLVGTWLTLWKGWWWADPVAAMAMLPLMLKEGWEGVRGEGSSTEP